MSMGTNILVEAVLKSLKIDKEKFEQSIAGIVQIALTANSRLTALENSAARIEAKLNLLLDAKGLDYAGTEINAQGNAGGPVDITGRIDPPAN